MFLEAIRRTAANDWWLLLLLGLWSVAALTIIFERMHYLWNLRKKSEAFKDQILATMEKGEISAAAALCQASQLPIAQVFERGFQVHAKNAEKLQEAIALRRAAVTQDGKRYLWLLGTVGSTAPFVGLFGTIIGIMDAFHSMSVAGTGGFKVVAGGISSALIATAIGLAIALIALVGYNYLVARIAELGVLYKVISEEFALSLGSIAPRHKEAA